MKKLTHNSQRNLAKKSIIAVLLQNNKTQKEFILQGKNAFSEMNIEFYNYVGELLSLIGFNTIVTRSGDVNCRFDATIQDSTNSIPIEIKSPGEEIEISIKAITQACENKIVLMSRRFFPTRQETTSLAIGFEYPPCRSDVYELIDNIHEAYNINIGLIDIGSLLRLVYDVKVNGLSINYRYFNSFKGVLNYEEVIFAEG